MDRERKLLYIAAFLGFVLSALNITAAYSHAADLPANVAAPDDLISCKKQLVRAWAQCAPRHLRNPEEY